VVVDGTVAQRVWMPSFEGSGTLAEYVIPHPLVEVRLAVVGTLQALHTQTLVNFAVCSMKQICTTAKHEATAAVGDVANTIATSLKLEIDEDLKPTISASVSSTVKLNGQEWSTQSVELVPPASVKISTKPRDVTAKIGPWQISGSLALEITVTAKAPKPLPEPVYIKVPSIPVEVVAPLVLLAAAVMVATSTPIWVFATAAVALGVIPESQVQWTPTNGSPGPI